METLLLIKDGIDRTNVTRNRLYQAIDDHHKLYPKVREASEAAWEIWHKIGRTPPKGWSSKVLREWQKEYMQLKAQLNIADTACQGMHQTFNNFVRQIYAKTLGKGQFGHSGKPATKPAKPSKSELREAYMLANRALHTQRAKFFKLEPQEKRFKLVATAKELAKLVSARDKAHYNVIRASSLKFSHEARALLEWKNPTGGIHALLIQSFKTSHLCQPLQLPFQLLWPPDPVAIQPQKSKSHSPAAKNQPPVEGSFLGDFLGLNF